MAVPNINYNAGFLPQNLYQNLLDTQRQGLAERNRREMERARGVGGLLGSIAQMDTGRSGEAEKDFIAKRNDELARMKEGLKDIDPINAPQLYQQEKKRIQDFERGSQAAMDKFKDSGFLGLGRDRDALQLPEFERKAEGFDSAGVTEARGKQKQMVGAAQAIRDKASKQFQDRGQETTDRLLDAYDLEEQGDTTDASGYQYRSKLKQAQEKAEKAQGAEGVAEGFLRNREKYLQGVKGDAQQQLDDAVAQQEKEREGQIFNAGLGIYQDKESFAPIAEYERGFEDIKRKKLLEYDEEVGEAERSYLDASDKGALERMEKYLPEMERIKRGLDVKKMRATRGEERKQFVLDELAKIYQVEPDKLKAELTRNKEFNEQALTQKYEELSKLRPLQLSIERERYQQETGLLAEREKTVGAVKSDVEVDKFTRLEQAKTDGEVARSIRMRPQQIETLRQTLKTQRESDYESWKGLGKEQIQFKNEELVKQTAALGLVKLSDEFRRFGEKFDPVTGLSEDGESIESLNSQKEYNDLVDRLEAQSEVKLDEAENMSAILNNREKGRLEVQLQANIQNWTDLGLRKQQDLLDIELRKAEELGDIEAYQELNKIITLDPLRQKNALQLYKDKKVADIEAKSGDRIREIIQKAGKDITDDEIKNLAELGNSPTEKILLEEFGKASKKGLKRQDELNMLSLPDNIISPRRKFEIAQKQFDLPATMTYENSQAKLSLITNLINSGETPSAAMLEGVGMGGMIEEVKKVVEKKQEPFKKEALMNSLVGLIESSVAVGEDGKPDQAKQDEALTAFQGLSQDADTKKLLDKYGYNESWFKGQSSVKLRAFTKELAGLRQTNSQTALNLAKKSYTESQVPKLTPQQQEQATRAKQYRDQIGKMITKQLETDGTVNMDTLKPAIKALQMEYFPEMKEAERKRAAGAVVKGFLNRVPDGTPEMARNVLNNMSLELSDEELNNIFSELKPKPEPKQEEGETKDPDKPSEAGDQIKERASLTKLGRPPDTRPIGQLYYDIATAISSSMKPGSLGEYLFQ